MTQRLTCKKIEKVVFQRVHKAVVWEIVSDALRKWLWTFEKSFLSLGERDMLPMIMPSLF